MLLPIHALFHLHVTIGQQQQDTSAISTVDCAAVGTDYLLTHQGKAVTQIRV